MDSTDSEQKRVASESDQEVVRLWRAWRTVHEMCRDRGYELDDDEMRISLQDFRARFTDVAGAADRKKMQVTFKPSTKMMEKFTPLKRHENDPDPPSTAGIIYVEFHPAASVGIKNMREFAHVVSKHNYSTGILITQTAMTPSALKLTTVVAPLIIEVFTERDLLVNITHHELVPEHVVLSPKEKKELLERYRLKDTQLPRIQTGDPVAKYLGLRRNQVVKIIRKSETAGRYASYRCAI